MGYKEGYLCLFREISEIIEKCKAAQAEAEKCVISGPGTELTLFDGLELDNGDPNPRPP